MTGRKRRIPRQTRASATVDAILTATLQLLEAEGPRKLTTNHIAARAGVSVGTIYQYFRDKDAILTALAERRAIDVRDEIADLIIHKRGGPTIRPIVRIVARAFEGSPRLQSALLNTSYRLSEDSMLRQQHEAFLAAIEGKTDLGEKLTPERAFILTHAPISLLRSAAAESELGLDPAVLEDEIVTLLDTYLRTLKSRAPTVRPDDPGTGASGASGQTLGSRS